MAISDPGRGLVRRLGVTAAAVFALAAASQQRAEALSLASPGTAPAAKYATDGLTTEVRHGGHGGGGGFRGGGGGGFRGGGRRRFRGGGAAFHGGGFRGGGAAFHGGGIQRRLAQRVYRGGGFRAARVYRGGGIATATVTPITGRISTTGATSIDASIAPAYYGYPLLLRLPAPLLPRGLDLLRAAQDLPLPSVASAPLASPLLRIPLLVRRAETKQAPGRAPVFVERQKISLLNPSPCRARA